MTQISSNEDLDAFIWAALQGSTCSQDYIDFIRYASGRPAPYEEAFLQAERYWRTTESLDAPPVSKFVQVVAEIRAQAEIGNSVAMLHLAQFFINGVGVPADEAIGRTWLRGGVELENADCMILLGCRLRKTDGTTALQMRQHAVPWGRPFAHREHAEIDPQLRLHHLERALEFESPQADDLSGGHLVK